MFYFITIFSKCVWLYYFIITQVIFRHFFSVGIGNELLQVCYNFNYPICGQALISAWGSFTCRKSTTRDPRLYLPFQRNSYSLFLRSKKSIDPGRDRTCEPRVQRRVWQPLDHRGSTVGHVANNYTFVLTCWPKSDKYQSITVRDMLIIPVDRE